MRAWKTIGNNARTYTLFASVLAKDPKSIGKAKQFLTRAMAYDPNLLDPVYIMVDIYMQEQEFAKGTELWVFPVRIIVVDSNHYMYALDS